MSAPSRRRDAARAVIAALLLGGCIPDFGGFDLVDGIDADVGQDAGPLDAGLEDAGVDAAFDGGSDAGTAPSAIDTECDPRWTDVAADAPPPCAGRAVFSLGNPTVSLDVAIGRANDGTLTIAFNDSENLDTGLTRTVRFHESTPAAVTEGPSIVPMALNGENAGIALALATEAPDIHHIAYWLRSDFGHEVRYRTLRGATLGTEAALAVGSGPDGALAIAVDSEGRAAVGWHDDSAGTNSARRENGDGTWSAVVNIRTDGEPGLRGPGAFAMVPGPGSVLHVAFQWSITLAASAPSYSVGSATSWSLARTLDNTGIANRASGVGIDLTLVGDEVVAAYLDWASGSGEVRIARFRSSDVEPRVTRHLEGIQIPDLPGRHPIALATDVLGRLHLLVADAGADGTLLLYHRQTLVAGELQWIDDTVARIGEEPGAVEVDMVLGPDRRPHIVYFDPERSEIRYATIDPDAM